MRALVFDGDLRVDPSYPMPERRDGEALIRVTTAGICNTDLEITAGYMGFRGVLGHEFVGIVQEADSPQLVGRRVVGEINCGCGHCDACQAGLERHCPHRSVLGILGRDGAFAEYVTLPERNLHVVPPEVEDDQAVFAEPLAAACEILEQVQVPPTLRSIVLGDGKLGLLVAQILAMTGCQVTVIGHHDDKLEVAQRLGIEAMPLERYTAGRADLVVECTGSSAGLVLAGTLVRPRGTVVLKSTAATGLDINMAPFVIDEITVVGSRCGPFPPALRALARNAVQVKPLITARYSLDHGLAALEHARDRESIKVLLRPWQLEGHPRDPSPRQLTSTGVRPSHTPTGTGSA